MTRVLLNSFLIRFDGKPGLPGLLEHESELMQVCIGEVRIELNGFPENALLPCRYALSLSLRVPNDNRPRKDADQAEEIFENILWHRRSVPLPYKRLRDCNKASTCSGSNWRAFRRWVIASSGCFLSRYAMPMLTRASLLFGSSRRDA